MIQNWQPERPPGLHKAMAPQDLEILLAHPLRRGLEVVVDSAVTAVVMQRQNAEALGVQVLTTSEVVARLTAGASLLWVSAGTGFTQPATSSAAIRPLLARVGVHAAFGVSSFNAGYAGLSIFDGDANRVAVIAGGVVIVRPEATLDDS